MSTYSSFKPWFQEEEDGQNWGYISYVILDVDATFNASTHLADLGGVFRDYEGNFPDGFLRIQDHVTSP